MTTTPNDPGRARLLVIPILAAVVSSAATGSPTHADEPPRITVSYADLNIESAAGLKALYGRLQTAAQNACRPVDDGRRSPGNFRFWACYTATLDSAVTKVNKPSLTAMHYSAHKTVRG